MKYPPAPTRANAITKAAAFVRGKHLSTLYRICELQKTISTSRLEELLDIVAEELRLDGIFLREISKKLPEDSKQGDSDNER